MNTSLQGIDTVRAEFGSSLDTLTISKSRLLSVLVSGFPRLEFRVLGTNIWEFDKAHRIPFTLFVQWLYTDRYHEHDCYASGLHEHNLEQ
jgi:hypothetical protein